MVGRQTGRQTGGQKKLLKGTRVFALPKKAGSIRTSLQFKAILEEKKILKLSKAFILCGPLNFFSRTVLLIIQQPNIAQRPFCISKRTARYPLSPHIKTIAVAFLHAE